MYVYAGNNPVIYTDPDGNFAEIAWDFFSLVSGVGSLIVDIRAGNVKGAVIDGFGIAADVAAVALPFIPGGAGFAIKSARITGAASNIAGGILSAQDGFTKGDYLEAGMGVLQTVSGIGQGIGVVKRIANERKALNFYTNSGMSKIEAKSHMQGIDFSKKVSVTELSTGSVVDQYQLPGGRQGRYYTIQGGNPDILGIDSSGRIKNSYIVNQPTSVLQSTAADTRRTGLDPQFRGKGGGIQYFSNAFNNFTLME